MTQAGRPPFSTLQNTRANAYITVFRQSWRWPQHPLCIVTPCTLDHAWNYSLTSCWYFCIRLNNNSLWLWCWVGIYKGECLPHYSAPHQNQLQHHIWTKSHSQAEFFWDGMSNTKMPTKTKEWNWHVVSQPPRINITPPFAALASPTYCKSDPPLVIESQIYLGIMKCDASVSTNTWQLDPPTLAAR